MKQQIRRQIHNSPRFFKFFSITIVLVLALLTISQFFHKTCQVKASGTEVCYYTTIQVQEGDTLWSIANDYITGEDTTFDSFLEAIIQVNRLQEDLIYAGDYLTIPYYQSIAPIN
ncbi:MAG: LysM peptidoglycan-binding domain-containing protein [Lachnospiraceae bacterium]